MRLKLIFLLALFTGCATTQPAPVAPVTREFWIKPSDIATWAIGFQTSDKAEIPTFGTDNIGSYAETTLHAQSEGVPLTETIRTYANRPVTLFSVTYNAPAAHAVIEFPDFTHVPAGLHVMSYRDSVFSPPSFNGRGDGSPWLLFDDAGNAIVISPASHFLIQTIGGDLSSGIASQVRKTVTNIPAGFTQRTLVATGNGINHTWDEWGRALTDLQGKVRPANDADPGLKYLGYWTDNGSYYYYNYDRKLGYQGQMLALAQHFREEQIPVKYLQLDSWWYYKTMTGPDGKPGKTKNAKLPAGEWNRYGGLLEYRAHPAVFPKGLAAFQEELGLPLITHNRWVDPASPYHQKYHISGYAALDPAYWNDILGYIATAGVVTYEQDWLIDIYHHSPELSSTVTAGDEFTDGMANAAAAHQLTLQYCMATPCFFMQGSKYPNLTTIRCSDDRFTRDRWHDFLYTSRLASALGIWPWTDCFMSSETGNMLVADLSAGMVGFGDKLGKENTTNIFRAVRADGVIVKPDVPLVPVDSAYVAEANGIHRALVASTLTDHEGIKTFYVLAFRVPPRQKVITAERPASTQPSDINTASFSLSDLGISGPAYVYDFFTHETRKLEAGETFSAPLGKDGFSYFVVAQPGISGIALFGDADKFVSAGKERVASLHERPQVLVAQVLFSQGENNVRLHGCAEAPVEARVGNHLLDVHNDRSSHHFYVDVNVNQASAVDATGRRVQVEFSTR